LHRRFGFERPKENYPGGISNGGRIIEEGEPEMPNVVGQVEGESVLLLLISQTAGEGLLGQQFNKEGD